MEDTETPTAAGTAVAEEGGRHFSLFDTSVKGKGMHRDRRRRVVAGLRRLPISVIPLP